MLWENFQDQSRYIYGHFARCFCCQEIYPFVNTVFEIPFKHHVTPSTIQDRSGRLRQHLLPRSRSDFVPKPLATPRTRFCISHFRNIIPELSKSFHVIAPDYPGFGNSDRPDPKDYSYTFVSLADTIGRFTELIGLTKFSAYIFDFGAPIALIIGAKHPERITGFFSQSGNAYEEGLSPAFADIKAFWANPSKVDGIKHIFTPHGIDGAYKVGVDATIVAPDAAALDIYYTSRPGAVDIQLALLQDYENNVKSYPAWQEYLRKHKPKLVAVWGKHDPFFIPPGAEAFKRDLPDADITIIDAGHFLNETHPQDIIKGLKKLL